MTGRPARTLRLAALAAAAATILPAVPAAQAEPFAGRVRTATGSIRLLGRDKIVYRLSFTLQSVEAAGAAAPAVSLQVGLAKCGFDACGAPTNYLVPITAAGGQVASDLSEASITTSFAGQPLRLAWILDSALACCSGAGGLDEAGVWVAEPGGGEAGVFGSLLSVTCGGEGEVVGRVTVREAGAPVLSGARPPARTPAAFTRSGRRGPSCYRG